MWLKFDTFCTVHFMNFQRIEQYMFDDFLIMMGTLGVTGVTPKRFSLLSFFLWVTLDQVTELVVVVFPIGFLMGGRAGDRWDGCWLGLLGGDLGFCSSEH